MPQGSRTRVRGGSDLLAKGTPFPEEVDNMTPQEPQWVPGESLVLVDVCRVDDRLPGYYADNTGHYLASHSRGRKRDDLYALDAAIK